MRVLILFDEYKIKRNLVTRKIRQSKLQYFRNVIQENSNSGKLWREIKRVFPSKNSKHDVPHGFSAEEFNNYFADIGQSVTNQYPPNPNPDVFWKGPESRYRFSFLTVSPQRVLSFLKLLPNRSYTDVLGFDSKLLKCASSEIGLPHL